MAQGLAAVRLTENAECCIKGTAFFTYRVPVPHTLPLNSSYTLRVFLGVYLKQGNSTR